MNEVLFAISWGLSLLCCFGFGMAFGAYSLGNQMGKSAERIISGVKGVINEIKNN
jgi:hypothetical protein